VERQVALLEFDKMPFEKKILRNSLRDVQRPGSIHGCCGMCHSNHVTKVFDHPDLCPPGTLGRLFRFATGDSMK
jgi:hypothetical protein